MSANEFAEACAERTIDPALAIEHEAVRAALLARDRAAVIEALDTQF